jgi:hypothetical protein
LLRAHHKSPLAFIFAVKYGKISALARKLGAETPVRLSLSRIQNEFRSNPEENTT